MKYERLADYSNKQFRRITGVKRETFQKMVEILKKAYAEKHQRRGRKPKLSIKVSLYERRTYKYPPHGKAKCVLSQLHLEPLIELV